MTLTRDVAGSSPALRRDLAFDAARAADNATGLIPSAGYSAVGTLVMGAVVGGLILLSCCFWFASRRESRVRARIEPHIANDAKSARARRKEGRAATRARFVDAIENAFANVKQFKQLCAADRARRPPAPPRRAAAICAGAAFVLGLFGAVLGMSSLLTLR